MDESVTMVFTWDVTPGREADFEEWAHGINSAATRFAGHMGATWLRAEGVRHRYYTVVKFAGQERLDRWLDSAERAQWIGRLGDLAEEHRQRTTGMETWFSVPGEALPPPSKLKMAAVTFAAVFPLSIAFQAGIAPLAQPWPLPARALLFPAIMVPLLTFAVMPILSRLLRRWLYPTTRTHPPTQTHEPA